MEPYCLFEHPRHVHTGLSSLSRMEEREEREEREGGEGRGREGVRKSTVCPQKDDIIIHQSHKAVSVAGTVIPPNNNSNTHILRDTHTHTHSHTHTDTLTRTGALFLFSFCWLAIRWEK